MNGEQKPSFLTRLLSVAFFSVSTISSLVWFFVSANKLLFQISLNDPIIVFDKGSMYMLGVGIGLLSLTIGGLMQGILSKPLTSKMESLFKLTMVVSIIVMAALPQLAQHLIDRYAREQHYSICGEITYRWFLYRKYYYTDSQLVCNKLVKEKEITKSSSGR